MKLKDKKIVLASSAEFAINTFKKIIDSFNVVAIVTNEDSAQGRGLELKETPVATFAKENNIKVFKTNKIDSLYDELKSLDFDLFLTFSFGQYISERILKLGKYPALNIHGSILPKYRGPSPIQTAILNNEKEIGISLIQMVKKIDAGDIFFIAKKPINEKTNSLEAFLIVKQLAEDNIVEWLNLILENKANPFPQGPNFTLTKKFAKEDCEIKLNEPKENALRKIKAFYLNPGAFVFLDDQRIKIFNASDKETKNALLLKFNDGNLWANEFQLPGKKRRIIN